MTLRESPLPKHAKDRQSRRMAETCQKKHCTDDSVQCFFRVSAGNLPRYLCPSVFAGAYPSCRAAER